jgi:hypothetical protein
MDSDADGMTGSYALDTTDGPGNHRKGKGNGRHNRSDSRTAKGNLASKSLLSVVNGPKLGRHVYAPSLPSDVLTGKPPAIPRTSQSGRRAKDKPGDGSGLMGGSGASGPER